MRWTTLSIGALLSLLLCVAVCVLWVRSYWLRDRLVWPCEVGYRLVESARGHVVVDLRLAPWWGGRPDTLNYKRLPAGSPYNWLLVLDADPGDRHTSWELGGFAWYAKHAVGEGLVGAIAVVPFWSIALATAVLPVVWALRFRSRVRERRRKSGLCPVCGYDLRTTPARCPECGAAPEVKPAAAE